MKRFVTYLYQYENRLKVKNTGFAKIEVKNGQGRMEIVVKGADRTQGPARIYLFFHDEKALPIGTLQLNMGNGTLAVSFEENHINGSEYDFSDVRGLAIRAESGCYIASSWVDDSSERLLAGDFEEAGRDSMPKMPTWEEPKEDIWTPKEPMEKSRVEAPVEDPMMEPMEDQMEAAPCMACRGMKKDGVTYRRIDLADIKQMPECNRHLLNNNFLLHGFFNYHYLLEKCVKDESGEHYYMGVPGVYEKPERMMAMLFGFMDFEPARQEELTMGRNEKMPENVNRTFGYYLCPIEKSRH